MHHAGINKEMHSIINRNQYWKWGVLPFWNVACSTGCSTFIDFAHFLTVTTSTAFIRGSIGAAGVSFLLWNSPDGCWGGWIKMSLLQLQRSSWKTLQNTTIELHNPFLCLSSFQCLHDSLLCHKPASQNPHFATNFYTLRHWKHACPIRLGNENEITYNRKSNVSALHSINLQVFTSQKSTLVFYNIMTTGRLNLCLHVGACSIYH